MTLYSASRRQDKDRYTGMPEQSRYLKIKRKKSCKLYAGLSCAFLIWSSLRCINAALGSVFEKYLTFRRIESEEKCIFCVCI